MKSFEEAGREAIVLLNAELVQHRHNYYVLNTPSVTDTEYDRLERQLAEMVQQLPQFRRLAPILDTVGSDVTGATGRIKHRTPMLSLENKYDFEELKSWCDKFPEQKFILEPKVDGASAALHYINRKLVKAVTRGDGQFGEDVTKQMAASGAVPLELPEGLYPDTPVEIRGEVFITVGQFEKLNAELEAEGEKPYASPRNLAAGSMKLNDLEEVRKRGLRFFVWQVDGLSDEYLKKRSLSIDFAHHPILYVTRTCTFPASHITLEQDADSLIKLIDGQIRIERETVWTKGLGMQTDGVVIKLSTPAGRKEAGVGSKYVNWGCAWKYPSEKKGTILRDVLWQTGRTGSMTPVGQLDPINVGGAVVRRVTLNNYGFIRELGVELGDEILLHRGGEVIPVCSGVNRKSPTATPIPEPTVCACGGPIVKTTNPKSGVISHWCESETCTEQLKARLEYLANRTVLEIDELGPELIAQLVEDEYVLSLSDLFEFATDITKGVATKGAAAVSSKLTAMGYGASQLLKMAASIEKCKTRDWDKWIAALDIPNIGRSLGKVLAIQCRLQSEDMPNIRDILRDAIMTQKIEGIGEIRKEEAVAYLTNHGAWFCQETQRLYDLGVRPVALIQAAEPEGDQPLAGYVVCITGEFSEEREKIAAKLSRLGATMKTGVSKKLTHLIVGEGAGRSKLTKAAELNLPKLDKAWLIETLEANGMKLEKGGGMEFDDDDDF